MVSARFVRLLPHDFQNGIYLRLEIMGCGDGYYTVLNSTLLTLLHAFILTCSHLHLGYQPWMTPNPLSSVSPGGSCKENEFHCENGCCVPADAPSVVCDYCHWLWRWIPWEILREESKLNTRDKWSMLTIGISFKDMKNISCNKILTWNAPSKLMHSVK